MTAERRSDRQLAAQLKELYLEPAPAYRFDVLAQTQHVRQRPRWTFPERWIPMAVLSLPRALMPTAPTRRAIAILVIVALVVAAVVAAIAGAPRYPPPFGLARNGVIVYGLGGDIYARDSVDAPARLLIGGDPVDEGPWFSRRGDRFIFYREVPNAYDLYVANTDGSGLRRLGGPFDEIETWDITPDGSTALVSALSRESRSRSARR